MKKVSNMRDFEALAFLPNRILIEIFNKTEEIIIKINEIVEVINSLEGGTDA